jgi:hypothetical protein
MATIEFSQPDGSQPDGELKLTLNGKDGLFHA